MSSPEEAAALAAGRQWATQFAQLLRNTGFLNTAYAIEQQSLEADPTPLINILQAIPVENTTAFLVLYSLCSAFCAIDTSLHQFWEAQSSAIEAQNSAQSQCNTVLDTNRSLQIDYDKLKADSDRQQAILQAQSQLIDTYNTQYYITTNPFIKQSEEPVRRISCDPEKFTGEEKSAIKQQK